MLTLSLMPVTCFRTGETRLTNTFNNNHLCSAKIKLVEHLTTKQVNNISESNRTSSDAEMGRESSLCDSLPGQGVQQFKNTFSQTCLSGQALLISARHCQTTFCTFYNSMFQ